MRVPKASVVLPIFNGEKYLHEAIDSVLKQSFDDFELLLIDDGSADNTLEIINHYKSSDSRCRVFTRGNKGLVCSLNEGIEQARGEIILRMDADDICLPDRFEKQIDYLDEHPECVALGAASILVDPDGLELCALSVFSEHDQIDSAHFNGLGGALAHPTAAIRRRALLAVGGYDEKYKHAEDVDLFLRLAEYGKIANISEPLLLYRQHFQSVGHKYRAIQVDSLNMAINAAAKRRGLKIPEKRISTSIGHDLDKNETYSKWAWWAIGSKNLKTALKYALKLSISKPFELNTLKLWYCIIRGH